MLRWDEHQDEWTLQSDYNGAELFCRPGTEIITVDAATIRLARKKIESCEYCHPDDAERPSDWILADVLDKFVSSDLTSLF